MLFRSAGARARKVGWQVGGDDPRSGRRRVDINSYAENLDTLCARAQARGVGVVFLLLPNREDLERRSPDPAWRPYRRVMEEEAGRWQAPLVDLRRIFGSSGYTADQLFLDQMHPTPLGHSLMATAVEAALGTVGWPSRSVRLTPPEAALPRYDDRFEGKGREQPAGDNPR